MKKSIFSLSVIAGMLLACVFVARVEVASAQTSSCPAGYVCTPIVAQPVNCPAGYICSAASSATYSQPVTPQIYPTVAWPSTPSTLKTYNDQPQNCQASLASNCNKPIDIPSTGCTLSTYTSVSANYAPKILNLDFGRGYTEPVRKSGPAIVGKAGDIWNYVLDSCDDHTKGNLKNADGSASSVVAQLVNLRGGWSTSGSGGKLGIDDPMLDDFAYPYGNRGGNAEVNLFNVPTGNYDLYIYNKTMTDSQNGDYTVSVGSRTYGRKLTTTDVGTANSAVWQENNQFVRFANIQVSAGEAVKILIMPGVGLYRDSQISGLQLAPMGTAPAVAYGIYTPMQPIAEIQPPVVANSYISSVSPTFGVAGSLFNINGTGFRKGDAVYFSSGSVVATNQADTMAFFNSSSVNQIYGVTVPNLSPGLYQVYVRNGSLQSNRAPFTVNSVTSNAPSITVIAPKASEKIAKGTSYAIQWRTYNTTNTSVNINLVNGNNQVMRNIAQNVANTGVFNWFVGNDYIPGEYKIAITSVGQSSITTNSDGFLTIYVAPKDGPLPGAPGQPNTSVGGTQSVI